MKRKVAFVLRAVGWLCMLLGLLLFGARCIVFNPGLYFRLQLEAGVAASAGVSEADLRLLDQHLADGLAAPPNVDQAFDNGEIEVFGELQPPFNERELAHLYDCRRLLAPLTARWLHPLLFGAGLALLLWGSRLGKSLPALALWLAPALLIAPVAALGVWAAVDFDAAFVFFHRLLFSNDLWLLNPQTDLLIRICPARLFQGLGLRLGLLCAEILLGLPALALAAPALLRKLNERKRNKHEASEI